MKLVSFLNDTMLLPDKETIFSHEFLELSKNAFIEKRKKTDSNFVNSAKVGAYGQAPPGPRWSQGQGRSSPVRRSIPQCRLKYP
jgi:hypothetical protein